MTHDPDDIRCVCGEWFAERILFLAHLSKEHAQPSKSAGRNRQPSR
jgi:hypothetical protein